MNILKGILNSFNSGTYTATVQISGSDKVYLNAVSVSRNISTEEMVPGRCVVIISFDEFNSKEAVITGVYTR